MAGGGGGLVGVVGGGGASFAGYTSVKEGSAPMLLFLVACMAAQLGGEETDGYNGSDPALEADGTTLSGSDSASSDTGSASDTGFGVGSAAPAGGTVQAREATPEDADAEPLEAFGMVAGIAVVDRRLQAVACDALPSQLDAMMAEPNPSRRTVTVDYGLVDVPVSAPVCVVSYTLSDLEAGVWTLQVGDRSVDVTVL